VFLKLAKLWERQSAVSHQTSTIRGA